MCAWEKEPEREIDKGGKWRERGLFCKAKGILLLPTSKKQNMNTYQNVMTFKMFIKGIFSLQRWDDWYHPHVCTVNMSQQAVILAWRLHLQHDWQALGAAASSHVGLKADWTLLWLTIAPEGQSGITRQDGPGLVSMLTSVDLCISTHRRLWHNVSTIISSHSVDIFS